MIDDDSEDDLTITITGINDSDTISLPYTSDDHMWTSPLDGTYTSTYTINDNLTTTLDSIVTGFDLKPEISIGKAKLTEEKLNDLLTLLDLIEQDPELKSKLNMRKAINKLKE